MRATRLIGLGAASALLSASAVWALPMPHPAADRRASPPGESQQGQTSCAQPEVSVTMEPVATVSKGAGRSVVRYSARVSSRSPSPRVSVSYVLDVLDAKYQVVASGARGPIAQLDAGSALRPAVETPSSLPDGYYIARLAAAVSDGRTSASNSIYHYFEVNAGQSLPIDFKQFTTHPDFNAGEVLEHD